jgi:hypothetical protein
MTGGAAIAAADPNTAHAAAIILTTNCFCMMTPSKFVWPLNRYHLVRRLVVPNFSVNGPNGLAEQRFVVAGWGKIQHSWCGSRVSTLSIQR